MRIQKEVNETKIWLFKGINYQLSKIKHDHRLDLRPVSPDSLRSGAPVHRDRFVSSFPTRE